MRKFNTGATRDDDKNKLDFEGFLSPIVLQRYAEYLNKHRVQADSKLRDSDNWQKGIPKDVYMKSGFRHFIDWWKEHRGHLSKDGVEDALCAVLFNTMGYLFELLKEKNVKESKAKKAKKEEAPQCVLCRGTGELSNSNDDTIDMCPDCKGTGVRNE